MTTTVSARRAPSAKAPFEKVQIQRRDVGAHDISIDIKWAGICHSDIHTGRDEWGEAHYPLVPGHEIAGVVSEVGSDVTKYSVGDHVGVGCMVDSCRECENCKNGEEQFCLKGMVGTYNAQDYHQGDAWTDGGYSTNIVVDENYVLRVPDAIELDQAAPLLCAGITTFSPLKRWGAGPGTKVGVVGMGGLGHMAVQLAHAMGAEVSVLSRTKDKESDGAKLGADNYYATEDESVFEDLAGSFDLIINTVSANLPIEKFLGLLKVKGVIVNVGAPSEPMELNAFSLISNNRAWAGSQIGGIAETQEMLDFCAEHNIGAVVERINADQIDEAWDKVVGGDVRYRYVIDTSTI